MSSFRLTNEKIRIQMTLCRALKESIYIPKLYFSHLVRLDIVTDVISTVMGVPANIVLLCCDINTQMD